jgi:hypothetical protein
VHPVVVVADLLLLLLPALRGVAQEGRRAGADRVAPRKDRLRGVAERDDDLVSRRVLTGAKVSTGRRVGAGAGAGAGSSSLPQAASEVAAPTPKKDIVARPKPRRIALRRSGLLNC